MEIAAGVLGAILLVVIMTAAWATNALSLPGNWMAVAAAFVYQLIVPEGRLALGWGVIGVLCGLAVVGEVVEFAAGARGASKAGGSRRAAFLAVVGSIIGGVMGMFVGLPIPIPVISSLVAGLLLAGLGALAGAWIGETWAGRDLATGWRVGQAAFWSRIVGTLAKIMFGAFMLVVTVVALFV